ncbi:MAG: glycosyltransferase family 4 protein [Chitinispirillaceae bacterium]|nr:glycosyltransferase family 4 protein [Chitinispirillaceae bacterium]
MKLLLTLDFPPERGGIQRYLFERAARRFNAGDCIVVGSGARSAVTTGTLACRVIRVANPLSLVNKKWSIINLFLFCAMRSGHECRELQIECGNVYAAIAAWLVSLFRPVTYRVYTYGGELLSLGRASPRGILLKSVLRRSQALYVLGSYTRKLLIAAGIDKEIVVDPPRIVVPSPEWRRQSAIDAAFSSTTPLRILSVGRMVHHKGHDVLINACRLLESDDLPWQLTLVGSGPQEKHLGTLIKRFGLTDQITMKHNVDDETLTVEYRNADLFVLPSRHVSTGTEGFGIVLIEAMAHGVPVIAGRVGGIPEVLDEGKCGVLVKPDDPVLLAGAIRNLATDGAAMKQLAERGLMRVQERYAWN